MASIVNRSNYIVTVEGKPERTKRFPFNKLKDAKRYERELHKEQRENAEQEGPQIRQLEDNLLVRVRDRGYPEHTFNATSYEQAEEQILLILADRVQGRRIDYNKARKITLAQLFDRYIEEECPKHKGCQSETYTLNAFLADIGYESQYATRKREERARNGQAPRHYTEHQRRKREGIEWLLKPFADVVPTDFDRYAQARQKQGIANATIDREFDLISQVVNWAVKTLRYHVELSPFFGFKRPRYFNERSRRLRGDEGRRLSDSIREEDRIRSFKIALEAELQRIQMRGPPRPGRSWNKYFLRQARKKARADVTARGFLHIPFWEAVFEYLHATTSRRGEMLSLTWENTHLEANEAFYPDTKNGRSRDVPLRQHVIELLKKLPRGSTGRVFPITGDEIEGAWRRICKRAGVEGFRIHDFRGEGLSTTAETHRAAGIPLDLTALAALSGHRDLRMLARYSNLCAGELARRMDEAYALAKERGEVRKGRPRPTRMQSRSSGDGSGSTLAPSPTDRLESLEQADTVVNIPDRLM